MTMLIEIEGIGFPNKGAELMLYSITDVLRKKYGEDVRVCCRPWQTFADGYRLLGHKNIFQLGYLTFRGVSLGWIFDYIPKRVTDTFGVARPKDVDVILDASGFRYGDSWGVDDSKAVAARYGRMRKRGKKIVLLPQAFGPFENSDTGAAVSGIIKSCDLVFARDDVSYKYLTELCQGVHVEQAPDFTNLVEPLNGFDAENFKGKVAVVPNQRMLDKTDKSIASNYYNYLLNICRHLKEIGEDVIVINHEGVADREICERLSKDLGGLVVVTHWNPIYIKSVIGSCKLLVSSRFHGCVSALSQGVPVIATSWNHKYEMLLNDYSIGQNIVNLNSDEIDKEMIENALAASLPLEILESASSLKVESKKMWNQVFKCILPEEV